MAIMLRAKCPKCGELVETQANCYCGRCGTPISFAGMGMVQIYRMGSPVGIAVGYGIYLDGQPFGHIANKKSIRIPVPFGMHTLHITCGMTRRCQDLTFTLTPQAPVAYVKAHIKMGVWSNTIIIEPAMPSEMPME
jgi:hypothetical protein